MLPNHGRRITTLKSIKPIIGYMPSRSMKKGRESLPRQLSYEIYGKKGRRKVPMLLPNSYGKLRRAYYAWGASQGSDIYWRVSAIY
jgi:hypothetical protein